MILPDSLFIGHRHPQHAGAEWFGQDCSPYNTYLIPSNVQPLDAIVFVYGTVQFIAPDHEEDAEDV